MSELRAILADVLRGGGPGASAILHNCRLDGAGASAYGREAILELFRGTEQVPDHVQVLEGPHCAALFAMDIVGPMALFADIYEERVTRIWYLAPRSLPGLRGQRVDLPFDPNFGELTPGLAFDPGDQPDLSPAHLTRVKAWGSGLLDPCTTDSPGPKALTGLSRLRLYVLRAFSDRDVAAVLSIVIAQRTDGLPGLVQFPIAARLPSEQPSDVTVVTDEGEREVELARSWRPFV